MDRQTKNEWTELHQFQRNLALMVIYVPLKFEFDWTNVFELESGNENVDGQTDRQTDVGHINLIGGLVTRNPPNKGNLSLRKKIHRLNFT